MEIPVEITFRNMPRSQAIEDRARERALRLERFFDRIIRCRVLVERSHRQRHKGNAYHARIDVTVPDDELVVSRDPGDHGAHEDAYVAVRDAFAAMRRQLREYASRRRSRAIRRRHEPPPEGRVKAVSRDYGVIRTPDDRERVFPPGAVIEGGFARLTVGEAVRFSEASGDDGPVATTVLGRRGARNG